MSAPSNILAGRFGNVFLSKTKNLNIVSQENGSDQAKQFTVYSSLLETGAANPVALVVLVEGQSAVQNARLSQLDWSSVHVRSYNSIDELVSAGISIENNNPQKPTVGALHDFKDMKMQVISQTENSKTYQFEDPGHGSMTVFTAKPNISTGGNQLPRKTTFLPWLGESNFVYQK